MSDRVLVMWDGHIEGELPAKSSEQEIMLMATGGKNSKGSLSLDAAGKE
jgi:ABC-type sugar transport system ATPase subunit